MLPFMALDTQGSLVLCFLLSEGSFHQRASPLYHSIITSTDSRLVWGWLDRFRYHRVLPKFAWMNVYDHRFSALTLLGQGELRNKSILSHLYFGHLSPARGSMKIWCFLHRNTAISGANMLLCGAACPGQTPGFLSQP